MRVYLCLNPSQAFSMWRTKLKEYPFTVYTQKHDAIKTYMNNNKKMILDTIAESQHNRYSIAVILLDVPCKDLVYKSGVQLDPIVPEYTGKEITVYQLKPKKINSNEILMYEHWHFYIHHKTKRLKYKRTNQLYLEEQK